LPDGVLLAKLLAPDDGTGSVDNEHGRSTNSGKIRNLAFRTAKMKIPFGRQRG
jgi:hypothetical protein